MLDKLQALEDKYLDLEAKISDPDVIANQTEWQKYARAHAKLTDVVTAYREYKVLNKAREEAEEIIADGSDKELAAFYLAALNMRSVLLAAALVKGRLNARQAFEASCLEELWQAEKWGVEEEAEKRRQSLKQELVEIEDFLKHD